MLGTDVWYPNFVELNENFAIFSILKEDFRRYDDWPSLEDYTRLATQWNVRTATARPLRFEPQRPRPRGRRRRQAATLVPYELQIFNTGVVPTRPRSWHDFFNALIWCLFPRTKATLNARQVAAGISRQRTRTQELMAMFDEGGIVHVRHAALTDDTRIVFGHALHESWVRGQYHVRGMSRSLTLPPDTLRSTSWADLIPAVDASLAALIAADLSDGVAAAGI